MLNSKAAFLILYLGTAAVPAIALHQLLEMWGVAL